MITDPDELANAWREWVAANLGSDRVPGAVAADAAAEAALKGAGFEGAAEAARRAWRSAVSASPREAGKFPSVLNVAMGIAIGGAVASTLLAAGLGVAFGRYVGTFAVGFLFYNLAIAAINWMMLTAMRRGSGAAWTLALVLVSLGIAFDALQQGLLSVSLGPRGNLPDGPIVMIGAPGLLVGLGVFMPMVLLRIPEALALGLANNWMTIHLVTIQLPILLLLIAGRSWFRARTRLTPIGPHAECVHTG